MVCFDGTSIGSVSIAAPLQMADRGMRERDGLAQLAAFAAASLSRFWEPNNPETALLRIRRIGKRRY